MVKNLFQRSCRRNCGKITVGNVLGHRKIVWTININMAVNENSSEKPKYKKFTRGKETRTSFDEKQSWMVNKAQKISMRTTTYLTEDAARTGEAQN